MYAVLLFGMLAALTPGPDDAVRRAVQAFVGDDKDVRYLSGEVDLNGDRKAEVVVHLIGRLWCGSGGCPTLVLTPDGDSYRLVSDISITRPPIRALNRASHGWRHLAVWVQGGGILPGYEAELPFDRRGYAKNPTVPPARRLRRDATGQVVIPDSRRGAPLDP